jgi:membrane-associated protease RseP (regulator of RpoE activity)
MAEHREAAELSPITPRELRPHLILFGITLFTVFLSGATYVRASAPFAGEPTFSSIVLDALKPAHFVQGWLFAVPLLSILLAHEFGHYIAARIHRVEASLPYFIPLPFLSPLGTAGAVITMRGAIRSRSALLDIGAAGPLAGMVVALPVLALGLSLSDVKELLPTGHDQEGQCLLYSALKYAVLGSIPEGHDVFLHPTAWAGWAGLLVTMINLVPSGQLDGGHIAYALFGQRQNRYGEIVRYSLLGLFLYNLVRFVGPVLLGTSTLDLSTAIGNSMFWLVWFGLLGLMRNLSGTERGAHPPVEPGELTPFRRAIAWGCLVLFVLLFMPTPIATLN